MYFLFIHYTKHGCADIIISVKMQLLYKIGYVEGKDYNLLKFRFASFALYMHCNFFWRKINHSKTGTFLADNRPMTSIISFIRLAKVQENCVFYKMLTHVQDVITDICRKNIVQRFTLSICQKQIRVCDDVGK